MRQGQLEAWRIKDGHIKITKTYLRLEKRSSSSSAIRRAFEKKVDLWGSFELAVVVVSGNAKVDYKMNYLASPNWTRPGGYTSPKSAC